MSGFHHERLRVYQAAVEFIVPADAVAGSAPPGRGCLGDQLHRAATSIVFNIAAGAGEFSRSGKARLYRMARRSATECAAILDVVHRLELVDPKRLEPGRNRLREIVAMLTRMTVNLSRGGKGRGKGRKRDFPEEHAADC